MKSTKTAKKSRIVKKARSARSVQSARTSRAPVKAARRELKTARCAYVGVESKIACSRRANAGVVCSVHAGRLEAARNAPVRILVVDRETREVMKEVGPLPSWKAAETLPGMAKKTDLERFELVQIRAHRRKAA